MSIKHIVQSFEDDPETAKQNLQGKQPTHDSEDWLPIPGYEGLYGVTRDGRVWAEKKKTHAACWLKPGFNTHGYKIVGLYKDGVSKTRSVARLVAITYIPNPENKPQVNHIDGVKTNNHVSNLEWNTSFENQQHARRTGLHAKQAKGSRHGSHKLTEQDVIDIREKSKTTKSTPLAREYGVTPETIRVIKRYASWSWLKEKEIV